MVPHGGPQLLFPPKARQETEELTRKYALALARLLLWALNGRQRQRQPTENPEKAKAAFEVEGENGRMNEAMRRPRGSHI